MDSIDVLLKQLEQDNTVQKAEPVKTKKSFPWMNIIMFCVILVMGYFLWQGNKTPDPGPEPTPIVSIADEVTKYENLYSTYKGQSYNKLAELVEDKTINNRSQLLKNTQAILDKAREVSLGKLDEIDEKYIPKESFDEKREEVVKYLKEKANGFEKAGE